MPSSFSTLLNFWSFFNSGHFERTHVNPFLHCLSIALLYDFCVTIHRLEIDGVNIWIDNLRCKLIGAVRNAVLKETNSSLLLSIVSLTVVPP